jgi:hypothetical protein
VAGAYAMVYDAQHGHLGFTASGSRFLYAQLAPVADCSRVPGLPAGERALCPNPRHRLSRNSYLWSTRSPIHKLPLSADGLIHDFDTRVIRAEPLACAGVVAGSLLHYFEPGHHTGKDDYSETAWQFPSDPTRWSYPGYRGPIRPGRLHRRLRNDPNQYIGALVSHPHTDTAASRFLHAYQIVFYCSGQVLTPCLLVVLAALVLRRGSRRLLLDAALLAAAALTLLVVASALSLFDYRYELGAVLLLPAAAAMAATTLRRA